MNKTFLGLIVVSLIFMGVLAFKPVKVEMPAGAVSPFSPSQEINLGGNRLVGASRSSLVQATSTPCALQSPSATSTLVSAYAHVNINTTASVARLAKATTRYATTTLLGQADIAAGTELNLVASTSPISSGANTFSPNTWVVFDLAGSGSVNLNGSCGAVWEVMVNN